MKFKREHTHNTIKYAAGDEFTGGTGLGRFLYQRGALEPNGHEDDAEIMRSPGPRAKQRWNITETDPTILREEE